jgi:hypothetical protein
MERRKYIEIIDEELYGGMREMLYTFSGSKHTYRCSSLPCSRRVDLTLTDTVSFAGQKYYLFTLHYT